MDQDLFAKLSPSMQRELSLALLRGSVLHFPLFRDAQHSFVLELAQAHSWVQCLTGDLVAEEGQLVQEVVFVIYGLLQTHVSTSDGNASDVSSLEAGMWFGEACLFRSGCVRGMTVVAIQDSELAVLVAEKYLAIVKRYPRLLEKHRSIEQALRSGTLSMDELAHRSLRQGSVFSRLSQAASGPSQSFTSATHESGTGKPK